MRVLILEDDGELRRGLQRHLQRHGVDVIGVGSVREAIVELAQRPADLLLIDLWLPDGRGLDVLEHLPRGSRRPAVIVMTGEATIETAVGALRVGAIDYLLKPFSNDALDAALARVAGTESRVRPVDLSATEVFIARYAPWLLGSAPGVLAALDIVRRVAATDCTILVTGETGTGKELVARAIHAASRRGNKPWVAQNCAAVPEHLMESELFGYTKGAFTGANGARAGRFVAAHGGTLFLDEVGEMSLLLQAKLLRVLQEREVTPVGSDHPVPVDVRLVVATHRDLESMVAAGRFREDLLYRLDVIRVALPPLRERRGDIALLAGAFLESANQRHGLAVSGIDVEALQALGAYHWPGNVRQLAHVVERMALLKQEGRITLDDVPTSVRGARAVEEDVSMGLASPVLPSEGLDLRDAVERFEHALIRQALDRTGWNRNRAATLLKMNRTTLVEKLRKRGWVATSDVADDRGGDD
jgi:DNA-binding NtrC family response regulator